MRFLFILILFTYLKAGAADSTRLYDPHANAAMDINRALNKAKSEKKHVLLVIGGNWCIWCYRFNSFVLTDSTLKHLQDNNYIVYHLNYSKENRNMGYMKKLGYPQRFGFPVLVVLDAEGNRLHTQDSSLLEKGNGYDNEKVKGFFINWAPSSLNEIYYNDKE